MGGKYSSKVKLFIQEKITLNKIREANLVPLISSFLQLDLLSKDYKEAKEYIEDIRDICDDFEGLCQRNLAANTGKLFVRRYILIHACWSPFDFYNSLSSNSTVRSPVLLAFYFLFCKMLSGLYLICQCDQLLLSIQNQFGISNL